MKIYTTREIADLLKVNQETILRLLRNHKLNGYKIGKNWRISQEQLEQYLNRR